MDCIVHGVTKSQTWLSDFHCLSLILPASLCLLVDAFNPFTDKVILESKEDLKSLFMKVKEESEKAS